MATQAPNYVRDLDGHLNPVIPLNQARTLNTAGIIQGGWENVVCLAHIQVNRTSIKMGVSGMMDFSGTRESPTFTSQMCT